MFLNVLFKFLFGRHNFQNLVTVILRVTLCQGISITGFRSVDQAIFNREFLVTDTA